MDNAIHNKTGGGAGGAGLVVVLALLVLATALGVVYTTHHSRKLFVELQSLQAVRDELNIQWGRLLLEQSTLATPSRVESIARRKLGMRAPQPEQIVIVRPRGSGIHEQAE